MSGLEAFFCVYKQAQTKMMWMGGSALVLVREICQHMVSLPLRRLCCFHPSEREVCTCWSRLKLYAAPVSLPVLDVWGM